MESQWHKTPQEEDRIVDAAFREVLQAYVGSNHRRKVEMVERAFRFAKEAHKGARRRSGEPYILHPIAVAKIVISELGLGSTSICAALLHDVIEDTEYTYEDIKAAFGEKIASIVEGLTKISGGIFDARSSVQAETFRKLLLSMSTDVRVVLIKMADRLHNMRTLGYMRPEKQLKICGETLYVYAPLAHRLGLHKIKTELQDLAFRHEHPNIYADIMARISETEEERERMVEEFIAPVRRKLDAAGFNYEIRTRVKSVYSIWNKMEQKKVSFDEVYDLYAVRVVFENDDDAQEKLRCFEIYTFFTDDNILHPDRTRDWVSSPKPNGYRALHLTAMGPRGKWIEVQIRSRKMDEIAELGYAAHWKYKEGVSGDETELDKWMEKIKDILAHPEPSALDFLDTIKLNLFASEIYVFTPKGELKKLPKGSTVLDMAFDIHTHLGMHCIAGKVNHKLVPMAHQLDSGDQVEIITSENQHPEPEWLGYARTARALTKIRNYLRRDRTGEETVYRLDGCCFPVPGDDVIGFLGPRGEVVVHKVSCPEAMKLKASQGERIVAPDWGLHDAEYRAEIAVDGIDRVGILETICGVPREMNLNIRGLNIEADNEVFRCTIVVMVDHTDVISEICSRLMRIREVKSAKRIS